MKFKINDYTKNGELFQRALKVIPGGVYGHQGPSEGCAIPITAFPIFSDHAKGSYFWDVDGNRFIDYMCAYGPNIMGYNDDDVDAAAIEQIKLGNCVTSPSKVLVDFAELFCDTVDMADWVFFAKNGGDVTSFSIMIARQATSRKKILMLKGSYHGVAPWTQKLGCGGILEEEVTNNLYCKFNDLEDFKRVVAENKGEIACFITTPYSHPVFEDNELPNADWYKTVRDICTKEGIVLIFDDIRCGFRLDVKGSDYHYGIKADLECFCKAIANGYNVSALAGIDSLRGTATDVYYTGSYWLSAVPFAAGIASIKKMREMEIHKVVRAKGEKLESGLVEVAKANGFELIVSGEPSMWFMRLKNDYSSMIHQEWVAEMVKRGVFMTSHHNQFINSSLSDEDIQFTLDIADEAYKVVAKIHNIK
ncbi:MAG: aminotransferase class III-fold pyridoxal phosphate-dependent enzyme [Clostridia bacterium]|nr:aminotransferase class III-fold pyridoxal phosphate-dependent enzyme [Clostridia bacterium]